MLVLRRFWVESELDLEHTTDCVNLASWKYRVWTFGLDLSLSQDLNLSSHHRVFNFHSRMKFVIVLGSIPNYRSSPRLASFGLQILHLLLPFSLSAYFQFHVLCFSLQRYIFDNFMKSNDCGLIVGAYRTALVTSGWELGRHSNGLVTFWPQNKAV